MPTERVRPFVLWLEETYGSLSDASEVSGVPCRTLQKIKKGDHQRVTRVVAARVAEAVMKHKHGSRTFSIYENDEPPRYATQREQDFYRQESRWRPAGARSKK